MSENTVISNSNINEMNDTGGEVIGWGTAQQAGISHYSPGFDLTSNKNKYKEYFLAVKAAGV